MMKDTENSEMILETHDLTKCYGKRTVVDHVNMHIARGDIYGFIGKNGAGKTTLMRMVLSLARPTSGDFELFGSPAVPASGRRIGSLIEAPGLYKACTAKENLERYAVLYGIKDLNADDLLEQVGLGNVGKKKAGRFSLGMRQRLGIALAVMGDPEFVVLDEPVNGLDPAGMADMRALFQRLSREKGMTFLISSHLLDELARTVTKYGIINSGRLVEEISAVEILEKCSKKLSFTVDDVNKAAELLKAALPDIQPVLQANRIILDSHMEEAAKLNRLLNQNDVFVSEVRLQNDDLENYFMQKIGE